MQYLSLHTPAATGNAPDLRYQQMGQMIAAGPPEANSSPPADLRRAIIQLM